ncbi:MAG: hypothetical protein Q9162_001961 [Coniocarpon cinnabarinum]
MHSLLLVGLAILATSSAAPVQTRLDVPRNCEDSESAGLTKTNSASGNSGHTFTAGNGPSNGGAALVGDTFLEITGYSPTGVVKDFSGSKNQNSISLRGINFTAAETGLAQGLFWSPGFNGFSFEDCAIRYGDDPFVDSKNVSDDITTYFVSTYSTQSCTVQFSCEPSAQPRSPTLSSTALTNIADPAGYSTGWCGVHVIQHQKPNPSKDDYVFDVALFDAAGVLIGNKTGIDLPSQQTGHVDSSLPVSFDVTAGNVDDDAIWFHYGSQAFTSNDQPHVCCFGKYSGGKREGDCGFYC